MTPFISNNFWFFDGRNQITFCWLQATCQVNIATPMWSNMRTAAIIIPIFFVSILCNIYYTDNTAWNMDLNVNSVSVLPNRRVSTWLFSKATSKMIEPPGWLNPREGPGVKSRICPPYPKRERKRRLNGAVCRNHRKKRVVPCRC